MENKFLWFNASVLFFQYCLISVFSSVNAVAGDATYLMHCEPHPCSGTIIVPLGYVHCFSQVNALWL